jgi:hypothetical protein
MRGLLIRQRIFKGITAMSFALGIELPSGWTCEPFGTWPNVVVIGRPEGGFVSVHTAFRIFEGGTCVPRTVSASGSGYAGRDWKKRLIADAVAWLNGVMD